MLIIEIDKLFEEESFYVTNVNEVLEALKSLFKDVIQEALEAEMDETLGYDKYEASEKLGSNRHRRNGYSKKTLKSELGPMEINIPRDRNSTFESKLMPKHQRIINGIEEKIISKRVPVS